MHSPHHDHADALIGRLLGPDGPELGCEACFEHLDVYVEAELAGHRGEDAVPGLTAHLHGCPACREDYESLVAFLGGTAS
jgi:hypothetical protein